MRKNDILFICDFETTGVDPEKDYPIELGGLFVDTELNVIDTIDFYIIPPSDTFVVLSDEDGKVTVYRWKSPYDQAFEVHKIEPSVLFLQGQDPQSAVEYLLSSIDCVRSACNVRRGNGRIIIVSDNAQFEFNFMKKLFKMAGMEGEWPFHYSAWDTSLCLEMFAPDIGDAVPVHKALSDAMRLYRQLVRYAERVGFFSNRG